MTCELPVYGLKLIRERSVTVDKIRGPKDVVDVIRKTVDDCPAERFVVLLLNTQHEVLGSSVVTQGVVDASVVHPREVFQRAILANATAIVIGHNHPSGNPTPSPEDRQVTRQLCEAGRILGIPVIDHVIVGDDGRFVSFAEQGLL